MRSIRDSPCLNPAQLNMEGRVIIVGSPMKNQSKSIQYRMYKIFFMIIKECPLGHVNETKSICCNPWYPALYPKFIKIRRLDRWMASILGFSRVHLGSLML